MKLAVYGTLRRKYHNHRLLNGATFLGESILSLENHLCKWYGVVPVLWEFDEGSNFKHYELPVEVYEIDDTILERTDWLEGYPTGYDRKEVDTEYGKAWIYYQKAS